MHLVEDMTSVCIAKDNPLTLSLPTVTMTAIHFVVCQLFHCKHVLMIMKSRF